MKATDAQIKQAYRVHLPPLSDDKKLLSEPESVKLRAVEEAYSVLSSPSRRERYDQKLKVAREPIQYEVIEPHTTSWLKIAVVTIMIALGGLYFYKNQQNKARAEQLRLESAKAKAEADAALISIIGDAENERMTQERLRQQQVAEENSRRFTEQSRRESQQIHAQMQQVDANRARDIEREQQQAKADKIREEQAAKSRAYQQTVAMERALNRPIAGSSDRPSVVTIPLQAPRRDDPVTTYNHR